MGYLETSAALGINVREAFELLTRKIIEKVKEIKEF
jgi:GTPase SAR1 family protein